MQLTLTFVATGLALLASGGANAQVVFDAPVQMPGATATALEIVDLDGDGHADLLMGGQSDLRIALGNGDGGFEPPVVIADARAPAIVEDADGDGVLDIVHGMAVGHSDLLAWSRGLGGATFDPPLQLLPTNTAQHQATLLIRGDVDGDAHVDLSLHSIDFLTSFVYVLRGDGLGGFTTAFEHSALAIDGFVFADIDGDSFDDVLYTSALSQGIDWARAVGDGSFQPVTSIGGPGFPLEGALELGGDARAEVLFATGTALDRSLQVYRYDGGALSLEHSLANAPLFGSALANDVVLGDFDNDGAPDLAVLWGQHVTVFALGPDAELTPMGYVTTSFSASLAAGHVDEDGRLDLAAGRIFGGVDTLLNHTYFDSEPFLDLGGALHSAGVIPTQLYAGDLGPGESIQVRLVNAAPNVAAYWIAGLERVDLPFSGGVLIPSPDVVRGPFFSDAGGQLSLSGSDLPALLRDTYTQWWMVDPFAPIGMSASNAVLIEAD